MSMVMAEGLKRAASIIEQYQLESVIGVDCDERSGTRIQLYDQAELEKISQSVIHEVTTNISRAYVTLNGVRIFSVTSDVSDWLALEEIA